MKSGGYNAVSVYFNWAYHSPKRGVYDFTGVRDMDRFLDIAAEVGIYVLARPGPYINAETDAGGLPDWLINSPARDRSYDPDYIAAVDEWLDRINPIIARHQLTNGTGTVILYQNENEFGWTDEAGTAYMAHLQQRARADGITVPTFHNDFAPQGFWQPGTPGAPDLYAFDAYPQGFNCTDPRKWAPAPDYSRIRQWSPNGPLFTAEFQGGSLDYWGGPGYDKCRQLTGPDFQRVFYENNIAFGITAQNFYMTYGGTSWGWLPSPISVYNSYDYGAAITEGRQLTEKYAGMKQLGYFLRAVNPITKTDSEPDVPAGNPDVLIRALRNPDTGTRFLIVRHRDSTSTATNRATFAVSGADGDYPTVPQQGSVTLAGRDSKVLVTGYDMERQRLVYSTSEIMTHVRSGGRDMAVLYGRPDQDGETVLRYESRPKVTVDSGAATATWDAARKDLRLNYQHKGLTKVTITGGGRADLTLLLGDDNSVTRLWQQDTSNGSVIAIGPQLLRTARTVNGELALTGDTDKDSAVTVWAPPGVRRVTWNGSPVWAKPDGKGALTFTLSGPEPQPLPALTGWKTTDENVSTTLGHDDSSWQLATRQTTHNPSPPPPDQPVLYADDYGFHHGDVWYRGHFTATGTETSVDLSASTGTAGLWSAWLNGTFLGSSRGPTGQFAVPGATLRPGQDNVVAVLVRNMGHLQTYGSNQFKEARGLTSSTLNGSTATITWRLQGTAGGEDLIDPVRGPMNNGGLLGERSGWSLPNYPDKAWKPTTLPATQKPGVSWYRTSFTYAPVKDQDTSVALRYTDDPARHYRAVLFVNGWNLGQYVNDVGPQREFVIPNGILRKGSNSIAIASWAADETGGLGKVELVDLGTVAGGTAVGAVQSPGYDAWRYRPPTTYSMVQVTAPAEVKAGETFTVKAVYTPTTTVATNARMHLDLTSGWKISGSPDVAVGTVQAGGSATASWQVTAPKEVDGQLGIATVTGTATQKNRITTAQGGASFNTPRLPPTGTHWVSEMKFSSSNGWGPVERDTSNGESSAGDGKPISIAGVNYVRGLGAHANSNVQVFLGGNCTRFTATVGVDDEVSANGTVRFSVVADGTALTTTQLLRGTDAAGVPIDVDLTGRTKVELVIDDGGDGNGSDHASWGDAKLVCNP